MKVYHFTPHQMGSGRYLPNIRRIHEEGLRPHSSVCTEAELDRYRHHGFRSNRKGQWGSKVVKAALLTFVVDKKYLEPGCDGPGHFYLKIRSFPVKWELV